MTYSIGQVAKIMKVNPSTLRYYDQMGIFPNIKRVNGKRVFSEEDFKWLRVLKCMKKINMPIKKIQEYVKLVQKGDETLEERYQMILEQKRVIMKEIKELQNCYKEFEYKEWYYKTAIKLGSEKEVENSSPATFLHIDTIPINLRKKVNK